MNDEKKYKFKCGIEATQKKPSWGQDKKILALLSSLNVDGAEDIRSLKVKTIVQLIVESDLIERLFQIILACDEDTNWSNLGTDEVLEVIEDFFNSNLGLKKLLGIGKDGAGLL